MEGGASFRFRCAACGKDYAVDLSALPPAGARGPCKQCGAALVLFPDGRAEGVIRADAYQSPPRGPASAVPGTPVPPPSPRPPSAPAPSAAGNRPPTPSCPACGNPLAADLSKIPARGAKGRCGRCQTALVLLPDGRVERQRSPAPSDLWELQHDGEVLGPFTLGDLKELVLSGGLTPERNVRPRGGAWGAASAFAEVAALFPVRTPKPDATPPEALEVPEGLGDIHTCYAHPGVVPHHACAQCLRYLCDGCVADSAVRVGTKPVKVCCACGGLATEIAHRAEWTPFYRDMGQVLTSPLRSHALFYFAIIVFAELCKFPARFGGPYGLMAVAILTTFQMSFYLHVIREVGHGSYQFPEWPDMTDVGGMVGSVLKVFVVTLVALIPAFIASVALGAGSFLSILTMLGGGEGSGMAAAGGLFVVFVVAGVFLLVYAFYLPIAITIVAVFNTMVPALNPVLIARIIGRIGLPYVAAVALLLALEVMGAVAGGFLRGVPIGGAMVGALIHVYGTLVTCYILGRVVYENEERIGWRV